MADETTTASTTTVQDPNLDKWDRFLKILETSAENLTRVNEKVNSLNSAIGGIKETQVIDPKQTNSAIDSIKASLKGLSSNEISRLTAAMGKGQDAFREMAKGFNLDVSAVGGLDSLKKALSEMKGETNSGGRGIVDSLSGILGSLPTVVTKALGGFGKAIKDLNLEGTLQSVGIIAAATFQKAIWDKIGSETGYYAAQKLILPIQKAAMQAGGSFGELSTTTEHNMATWKNAIVNSSNVTMRSLDEVTDRNKELGNVMGTAAVLAPISVEQQTGALADLSGSLQAVGSSLTPVNAAMFLSSKTGIESSAITGMMAKAHLELGEAGDKSVKMFGAIYEASQKSNIGFESTAKSIMASADSLKLWGGTVTSVTPLFNMFSSSLKDGQKGLAPQLFQAMAAGIQSMAFEKRAFLGMQSGMGAKGGAIGAGLEMEAAMEKGPEGMKQIVGNLSDTLKQYGGGRIIKREEAIADPALQNGFMMQRQLLSQMIGVDQATATKTLDALSGIQDTGLQAGSSQEELLGNVLGQGKKIAEDAIGQENEMTLKQLNATVEGADKIVDAVKGIAERTGIKELVDKIGVGVSQGIATGEINPTGAMEAMSSLKDLIGQIGRKGLDKNVASEAIETVSGKVDPIKTQKTKKQKVKDELAATGPQIPEEVVDRTMNENSPSALINSYAQPQSRPLINAATSNQQSIASDIGQNTAPTQTQNQQQRTNQQSVESRINVKTSVTMDRDTIILKLDPQVIEEAVRSTFATKAP